MLIGDRGHLIDDAVNADGFVAAATTNGDRQSESSEVKAVGCGSGELAQGEVCST